MEKFKVSAGFKASGFFSAVKQFAGLHGLCDMSSFFESKGFAP